MHDVPFLDLGAQYDGIRREIDKAIASVLSDHAFIQGPHVARFEQAFADCIGANHCIGVSSGTSALTLALEAVGVKRGDEVITVSNTFFATTEAICALGATPVFIDIDAGSGGMDPDGIEPAITSRTTAIVPVHIYGAPCDMDPILAIARRQGLKVVEDAAQAHLALYKGRMAGTMGDAASFSFFPGKNLGAYGDAGAVTTADDAVAERVRLVRDHGRHSKYEHRVVGGNHRMDGLQGAVLTVKLRHLPAWTAARRAAAARYVNLFAGSAIRPLRPVEGAESAWHLFAVVLPEWVSRERVQEHLERRGIASGVHYPVPSHLQPAISGLPGCGPGTLPVSERLARSVLSIPIFPELSDRQLEAVAGALIEACDAIAPMEA
ncbi:MAG: hypothetical protein VR70_15745 [Rhodospirillaceae bacterium BRH_c57]|nr:MAG: hypothetical protein VR70_15745 [Rhodospirillaceae bacterium BRH_c57]